MSPAPVRDDLRDRRPVAAVTDLHREVLCQRGNGVERREVVVEIDEVLVDVVVEHDVDPRQRDRLGPRRGQRLGTVIRDRT